MNSSCNFVISLQITSSLSLKYSWNFSKFLRNFLGDENKIIEQSILLNISSSFFNADSFSDKKPKKINFSEKPLMEAVAVTEETPGIGIIGIFFETHSLISILPGSEITGVPASEIRDMILYFWRKSRMSA